MSVCLHVCVCMCVCVSACARGRISVCVSIAEVPASLEKPGSGLELEAVPVAPALRGVRGRVLGGRPAAGSGV